jgi:hypothetical protein
MKNLFALTILEVINLGFRNTYGMNPNCVGFENHRGNSIYVNIEDGKIKVSAYKVSKRCSYIEIENESDLDKMKSDLVLKLKDLRSKI